MHRVVVLALDDVIAFDLSTPIEVLGRAHAREKVATERVGAHGVLERGRGETGHGILQVRVGRGQQRRCNDEHQQDRGDRQAGHQATMS